MMKVVVLLDDDDGNAEVKEEDVTKDETFTSLT